MWEIIYNICKFEKWRMKRMGKIIDDIDKRMEFLIKEIEEVEVDIIVMRNTEAALLEKKYKLHDEFVKLYLEGRKEVER
jgi:hypothetical protein